MIVTLLAGCSTDQPAACDSLDAVSNSVEHLRSTNVSENGMSALQTNLNGLK